MEAGSWGQESLCQFLVHSARTLGSRAIMLNYPALISHHVRTVTPTRTLGAGIHCSIDHLSYR